MAFHIESPIRSTSAFGLSNMSKQSGEEVEKRHKGAINLIFEDKVILSKFSTEYVSSARNQYELLLEKTEHQEANSLQVIKNENPKTEMFSELKNLIEKCRGGQCKEKEEFDMLVACYNIWQVLHHLMEVSQSSHKHLPKSRMCLTRISCELQALDLSSEQIRSKPLKSKEASIRKRPVVKRKRLSITVRESVRGLPKEWLRPAQESKETQLKHENEMLRLQVDELTTRLSKIASDKLTDGNPNFANLSDKNRPTKIGERFGMVYDEEWSEAYEEIKHLRKLGDAEVYDVLLKIVIAGDRFCREVSQSQLSSIERGMSEPMLRPQWSNKGKVVHHLMEVLQSSHKHLPKSRMCLTRISCELQALDLDYSVAELEATPVFTASLKKFAKDFRRGTAAESIVPLCTIFKDGKFKELYDWDVYKMENLNLYVDACIECLWLMHVQDPPMHITWLIKGDNYEPTHFNMFMVKGKEVEYTVWPAVFLYKDGPLVSKGYVKLR